MKLSAGSSLVFGHFQHLFCSASAMYFQVVEDNPMLAIVLPSSVPGVSINLALPGAQKSRTGFPDGFAAEFFTRLFLSFQPSEP
jgi:hypothetical protein